MRLGNSPGAWGPPAPVLTWKLLTLQGPRRTPSPTPSLCLCDWAEQGTALFSPLSLSSSPVALCVGEVLGHVLTGHSGTDWSHPGLWSLPDMVELEAHAI